VFDVGASVVDWAAAALAIDAQELSLHVFGEGLGTSSLYKRRGIDFLKIDVGRHETSVLRDATELLRANRIAPIMAPDHPAAC